MKKEIKNWQLHQIYEYQDFYTSDTYSGFEIENGRKKLKLGAIINSIVDIMLLISLMGL